MDEKFRADKEVVLLAVNQCGHTLAFASELLKADLLKRSDPWIRWKRNFGIAASSSKQDLGK